MIPNDYILMSYFVMWYFLVGLAILFTLSGLDDLFFDFYYWIRWLIRKWKTRRYEPLTYEKLIAKEEQFIAVLVPCWNEANVIASMLKHNCYAINYKKYYFFVGVYPNDLETVSEVQAVARIIKHVQCVINDEPGPTNKALNLNNMYRYVKEFGKVNNLDFEIFVVHDSEDLIHPLSFKLFNYLVPRKDMVQLPVFPLEVKPSQFTHWLYADEFAENHLKDIIVRESLKAHVPSAGVGTAYSRQALLELEDKETGAPFSLDSLTEDYSFSLSIRLHNLKQSFVVRHIMITKWVKRWFSDTYVQRQVKEYIATRALFPLEYKKAVRQKARWIIGIVFQEWHTTKWPKGWRIKFSLAHDRKSFVTHFINGFAYIVFGFWLVYSIYTYDKPYYPSLQEQFNDHPWVWYLIIIVTVMMCERLLQRLIAVRRVYQLWLPAILSVPRTIYGNFLNLHALVRAYRMYYFSSTPKLQNSNRRLAWDKTDHTFPDSHVLMPYRRKLGDLLIENRLVSEHELTTAINEQQKTGERLGAVLYRLKMITKNELLQLIAYQYKLSIFPQSEINEAKENCVPRLPKKLVDWLIDHESTPIDFDESTNTIILTINDPTNERLIESIISHIAPYKAQFVLIDDDA